MHQLHSKTTENYTVKTGANYTIELMQITLKVYGK